MAVPIVGKAFPTLDGFLAYLESIQFGAWRPRYVVMHHTGAPDLKTWQGWQTRAKPVSDEQWMQNLKGYYEGLGWSHGPHFFFTPKNYCVFSLPNVRGTHAVSFNANSWGVECVGDFDVEPFADPIAQRYIDGLAALHVAAGLSPSPYVRAERGLHFHRDDPQTSKTCPGQHVDKMSVTQRVYKKMATMNSGDHPEEHVEAVTPANRYGVVKVPLNDTLNVRAAASGKAPVIATLKPGTKVSVIGETFNGDTQWYRLDLTGEDGWVAAKYVVAA